MVGNCVGFWQFWQFSSFLFWLFSFSETGNLQQNILFVWGGHFRFIPDVMKKNVWVQLFEI
jgi:hypothetical protein